jgi:replicative DNA helicase
MSTAPDDNDLAMQGRAPKDLEDGTKPMNPTPVGGKPRVLTVKQLLDASAERALSRAPRGSCTTGVNKLDDATGGLRPGHVWVFGADTNWGKSSFLIMLADENMKKRKRVLIVSSEDDESIYGDRLMVRRAKVNAKRYRDRKMTDEEMTRVTDVVAAAPPDPVFLDARGKPAEQVAAQVKWAIREHAIDIVCYDYLQEFRSSKRYQDRRNEVSEVAAMLREAIKTTGKTGIIFSQITVSADKKYPDKHSIRESRDVSNAAEVIVLGFTPTDSITRADGSVIVEGGKKCALVDKAKDGIKGAVELDWDEERAAFVEIQGEYDVFDGEFDCGDTQHWSDV